MNKKPNNNPRPKVDWSVPIENVRGQVPKMENPPPPPPPKIISN